MSGGDDVVFPSTSDQLGDFSDDTNDTVQISIPAESLLQMTGGNSSTGTGIACSYTATVALGHKTSAAVVKALYSGLHLSVK